MLMDRIQPTRPTAARASTTLRRRAHRLVLRTIPTSVSDRTLFLIYVADIACLIAEDNCPNSYAYAYDESSGTALWTCDANKGADYTITFCPA